MNDRELLRDYLGKNSQDAFRELVERHLPMVYAAARRIVDDSQLAEEVAQTVFSTLARKAASLQPSQVVGGWLYSTTRHLALNALRGEQRRREREQTAAAMQLLDLAPDSALMSEHLEPAMAELAEECRDALVLRYMENRSLREVGAELGISEDAARMKVNRALERLRAGFEQRGAAISAAVLATAITSSTSAVPAGLASAIVANAVGVSAAAGAGAGAGVVRVIAQGIRAKWAAGLTVSAVIGVSTWLYFHATHERQQARMATAATPAPGDEQNQPAPPARPALGQLASEPGQPDPLNLLQGVTRARQRISSGWLEWELSTDKFERGRKTSSQKRLTVMFDGAKLRFEARDRQYAFTVLGNDDSPQAQEIRRRAESMDREEAVRAGFLKPFEYHEIAASDGVTLCRFRESGGPGGSTTIEDPAKASGTSASYFFDPRCLGLRPSVYSGSTIERCLGYPEAKAIRLIGEETVDGMPAWHVQVQSKYDETLEFWIDRARPARLLKHAQGGDFAMSKYDDANPRDPLPIEVTTMESRPRQPQPLAFASRFVRTKAQWNVSVEPSSFTLAGLGMPIGTQVTDIRNPRTDGYYQDLGYWNGAGLSEFPPAKGKPVQAVASLAEYLGLLENDPGSSEARDAAVWILLNTPDGPEVEKAGEALLREHTRDPNLLSLCKELERLQHRCSRPLLEALLKNNPSIDVRGNACFALANWAKQEAKFGQDKKATATAEKLFERAMGEFGKVTQRGWKLEELARPELSELRTLIIGKLAPEIEGVDLDGQPMRLSDYRGKVVVLTFWWNGYIEAPEHRKLVEQMFGRPFAFVGVYGDDELAKGRAEIEKYQITWPSFLDKRDGPIAKAWNVRSWPNIWVLDANGVIRYRNARGSELTKAVETLLREVNP
ncbi:MAG TPA: sigma-70 family RNA polymerase sigma factor [Verrucomicrobiae bacterium]|nr:sigma-70 family RNA polymerase sigma factor [Verrucomicrobiae bacterium]